jgi:hypoxanthine-guanine phosphoribosyltransferase
VPTHPSLVETTHIVVYKLDQVLLIRRSNTQIAWDPRVTKIVVCYDIADEWIWGYGLDAVDGTGRTLNDIICK